MRENAVLADIKARIVRHFETPYSFNTVHGSDECCFENIAFSVGMLEDGADDADINAFYDVYAQRFRKDDALMRSDFVHSMMCNGLLHMESALRRTNAETLRAFRERLARVRDFAVSGAPIFYTEDEKQRMRAVPACWRGEGIVRQEHTSPYLRLPNVYDLLGFHAVYGKDGETDAAIDAIVAFILGKRYQEETKNGYGIGVNGEKGFVRSAYYAVGWDIHLSRLTPRQELLYMLLLSPVPGARQTTWYRENRAKY